MSYKIKTLIVFDTNSLRSTDAGEVAYSFFAFGRPFQEIEKFIIEKKLSEDIHIAIPSWAIEELKDQKQRQYKIDIDEFKKLTQRLSGLPHIPEITLPEEEFDCATYVESKAIEFLAEKEIILLEIEEESANNVLRSMMSRVMRDEHKKAPFANLGKTYKDAGFKDNIVWESLMNFEYITNYDKIIFLTKDGDFNKHCEAEFIEKWQRHISILKDENNVLANVLKDYGNYIQERAIHDFAQTEYFRDYLHDELKVKTNIVIEGKEYPIENFTITDICKNANRLAPNEEEVENIFVSSEIKIHFTKDGEKKEQTVEALTLIWDDESKDIQPPTEFDFELL